MKYGKLARTIRKENPLCFVCKNPSREVAHLVSRMEFRQQYGNNHPLKHDRRNLLALCKRCHIALDCQLGITDWYVKQKSIVSYDFFLKHFDRHYYGFQKVLDRRCMLLCELERDPRPGAGAPRRAGHAKNRSMVAHSPEGTPELVRPRHHALQGTTG